MERQKKKQKGITLIALVISIIVMLILAGVSLNMTIGENGIIKQAQGATYQQSRAILEEYINQYYVEHYDEFESANNKVLALKNYSGSSSWFYQGAPLGYVVDSDGNAHYFINVKGLPSEVKSSVKGGDANGKINMAYQDYANMRDIYGVTSDLRVYYCSNGKESLEGVDFAELEEADSTKEVFEAGSAMAKLITGSDEKNLTLEDLKGVKTLTITAESGISSLSDFYALVSLKNLTLDNVTLANLDGIENAIQLNYIRLNNCKIGDYSAVGKIGSRLQYLYLYNTSDDEVEKMCDGISNSDLTNLNYFGIVGNNFYYDHTGYITDYRANHVEKSANTITSIEPLSRLSDATKKAVKYLFLNNNNITDISPLSGFSNVYLFRGEYNQIKTTKGLGNMNNLTYLFLNSNQLGKGEKYDINLENYGKNVDTDSLRYLANNNKLCTVRLDSNNDIKWISYLSNLTSIRYFNLNSDLNLKDISSLRNVVSSCTVCDIPAIYSLDLIDVNSRSLNLENQKIPLTTFESLGNLTKLYRLNLSSIQILDASNNPITDASLLNTKINAVLSKLTNMEYLKLYNLPALSTLDFVGEGKETKLVMLDLRKTSIIDLSNLNGYSTNMYTLTIDNPDINMTNINTLLNRFGASAYDAGINDWNRGCGGGLQLCCKELYDKIILNTQKRHMGSCNSFYTYPGDLDLSKMTGLTSVYGYGLGSGKVKLPSSVTSFTMGQKSVNEYIFPETTKFSSIRGSNVGGNETAFFNMLYNNTVDFRLSMDNTSCVFDWSVAKNYDWTNSHFKAIDCYQWNGYPPITGLDISGIGSIVSLTYLRFYKYDIKNLSEISKLINLTELNLQENDVGSLDGIENLTKLTKLILRGNNVSGVYNLRTLNNLTMLDIADNSLFDTSTYINSDGSKVVYNNLEILADLNKTGNLKQLYIGGNSGITDFSKITSLNWTTRSGF